MGHARNQHSSTFQSAFRTSRLTPPQLQRSTVSATFGTAAGRRRDCRVATVIAAAGYGKTTLAIDWAAHAPFPVAWLTVDASDNDVLQFSLMLISAAARVVPIDTGRLSDLVRIRRDPAAALAGLLEALTAADHPLGFVLDDVHLLTEPAVLELLSSLLHHQTPAVHWLLLSRHELSLSLGRLLLQDELHEVREDDLRLNHEQIAQLLEQQTAHHADPAEVDLIAQQSGGWAAGIRLLIAARMNRRVPAGRHGLTARVTAYLIDEVFRGLSDDLQETLLQTAFLPRLEATLCDAVTGRNDGAQMLQRMLDLHLFIERTDSGAWWYTQHQLWREVLLHLAEVGLSRQERLQAVQRAADWFVRHDDVDEAVRLLSAAGLSDEAGRLVAEQAYSLVVSAQLYRLERLISLLPPTFLQTNPRLLTAHCWMALILGDYRQLEVRLELLRERAGNDNAFAADLTALNLLVEYTQMRHAGLQQQALQAAAVSSGVPYARGWMYLVAAMSAGAETDPAGRLNSLAAALADFRRVPSLQGEMAVIIIHVTLLKHLGRFSECRHYAREQLAHLEQSAQPVLTIEARASVARTLADVLYLIGDTTTLDRTLRYFQAAADEMAVPLVQLHARVLCRLHAAVPSAVDDRLQLEQVRQQLHDTQVTVRPTAELLFLVFDTLRLAQRCGSTAQIPLLLDAARLRISDLAPDEPELLSLISAYSAVVAGPAPADLRERLMQRIAVAEQHQALHLEAWLRVLLAIHEQRSGQYSEARRVLRRGLHLIEQSGAIRIAADLPELQPILAAVNTGFARTLLGRLQPTPTADEFSVHEKQIISGLLRGLTSSAIAAEIGLAPATVHYHLTKIYRKLAVNRRADALERLRERFPTVD